MKTLLMLGIAALLTGAAASTAAAQENERPVEVLLLVPSTAYKIQIQEVYQTSKELWVLSKVEGKGFGATVISKAKDAVKVKAPAELPIKHFVLGKTWGWGEEKFTFLKNREDFDKQIKEEKAMKIFQRPAPPPPANAVSLYIVSYKKETFTDGKTKDGETLAQLAQRHAKQFNGEVVSLLQIIDGCTMRLTPENATRLSKVPEVKIVEKDQPFINN